MNVTPLSPAAFHYATSYVLFHWDASTWVWYVICALPICYMYYKKRGTPALRLSAAGKKGIGKCAGGPVSTAIGIFFCIGLIAGNTAIMGISIPIMADACMILVIIPLLLSLIKCFVRKTPWP